jgi:uncharacterized protein YdeI (YjbR/CyaY-like superfamily)
MTADEYPTLPFATRAAFEKWLGKNHAKEAGVWVRFAKKGSGVDSLTYAEAVEVALAHGWIDGQARPHEEPFWLQKFTPRRARSKWSRINRERAERLIQSGAMKPAGLKEVEAAKADGRWEAAYPGQKAAEVPADLAAALRRNKAAKAFFETLDSRNRFAIIYRVADAKKPETRARRIEQFVAMLAEGKKIH